MIKRHTAGSPNVPTREFQFCIKCFALLARSPNFYLFGACVLEDSDPLISAGMRRENGHKDPMGVDCDSVPQTWWFLQFASAEDYLGAAVVQAWNQSHCIFVASEHGCNPGGLMRAYEFDPVEFPDEYRYRLLSPEDIDDLTRRMRG